MLINPHPADWKEALHDSLRESQGFVYALVDGVHNEAVYQKLKKMDYLLYQPLYATAPSADEETLGLGPILVQYSNMYRKRWDAILDLTNGRPALSIIVTPEPMDRLAARLIPWCVVDADAYTVALSFADTRVLPTLVEALGDQQRGEFLGPATRWIYPGRDAAWLPMMVEPEKALPAPVKVALTAQQVSALMTASEPDSIAYQMSQYIGKPLAGYTPFDAHVMISRWLQVADHVKLESNRDRFALCEFGIERPELIEDARYITLLEPGCGHRTLDEMRAFLA